MARSLPRRARKLAADFADSIPPIDGTGETCREAERQIGKVGFRTARHYRLDRSASALPLGLVALRTCVDTASSLLLPLLGRGKRLRKREELDTFASVSVGPGEVITQVLSSGRRDTVKMFE
jgi:hypothetical protein